MNKLLALVIVILAAGCASSDCPRTDLGGWVVDDRYSVHHECAPGSEVFVLQQMLGRDDAGRVTGWSSVKQLVVPLRRDESTMFGFECGSFEGGRGDVIAVVKSKAGGSFDVKRAWKVDVASLQFVRLDPRSAVCESLE